MRYSTTYKIWLTICAICICFCFGVMKTEAASLESPNADATKEEQEVALPDADSLSNVLVIYPDEMTTAQQNSMYQVSTVLIRMGYTADYVKEQDVTAILTEYQSVICMFYEKDENLDKLLQQYKNRIFYLGNMPEGVVPKGQYLPDTSLSGELSGVMSYTFAGEETFSSTIMLDDVILPKKSDYQAGNLDIDGDIRSLVYGWGDVRYTPVWDFTDPMAMALLTQEITLWQWPYNDKPNMYSEFLVIDQVYPFTDTHKLLDMVNTMVERKVPFVISVMPIYQNEDFPAMQQFCEVLRYAQANGGTIVLHAPLVQNALDPTVLQDKLTTATQIYFSNGVYPVALSIPSSWVYQTDLYETLGRYRTLIVYDDGTLPTSVESLQDANTFVRLGFQLINPAIILDGFGISYIDCYASAVYLSPELEMDDFTKVVTATLESAIPLKSMWDMNQVVYTNKSGHLVWDGNAMYVNEERVSLDYEPQEYPANHDYKRNVYYRVTADISGQNKYLISFAALALTFFILSIILARRQMKKRFFISKKKK